MRARPAAPVAEASPTGPPRRLAACRVSRVLLGACPGPLGRAPGAPRGPPPPGLCTIVHLGLMKNRGRPSDTAPPGLAGFRKTPFFGIFSGFSGLRGPSRAPPGPPGPPGPVPGPPPGGLGTPEPARRAWIWAPDRGFLQEIAGQMPRTRQLPVVYCCCGCFCACTWFYDGSVYGFYAVLGQSSCYSRGAAGLARSSRGFAEPVRSAARSAVA